MGTGYRNETEAALARAEALEEENARLRAALEEKEVSVRLSPVEETKPENAQGNAFFVVIALIPIFGLFALMVMTYLAVAK